MRTHVKCLVFLGGLVALGCDEPTAPPTQTLDFDAPSLSIHPEGAPRQGVFTVCKVGSSADFEVEIVTGSSEPITKTVHVNEDECVDVHTQSITTDQADIVTITEIVPNGFVLDRVEIFNIDPDGNITSHEEAGPTISGSIRAEKLGCLAIFYNVPSPPVIEGRMTGGGFQIRIGQVRITGGLTLHCDNTLSNNLQINWPGAKWHIEKESLEEIMCIDDPAFEPHPPKAPFDTFIATAIGKLNGVDGSVIHFRFIDDGEPGRFHDLVEIHIFDPNDPSTEVLGVPLTLIDLGNLQAHFDQPHS